MSENSPDGREAGDHYTNVAQDDSRVEAQIGVVHGDVSFYKVSESESPEEKYRIGRNYLAGNMPRQAEQLICEAFMAGHRSTEVSYYWALSVLSNRSFDHLGDDEFDQLRQAVTEFEGCPPDQWVTALRVVARLVQSLILQEKQPEMDPAEFDAALADFAGLPAARRDELRRHLEMILTGGIQDRLEAQGAEEVAAKRMGDDRLERAWKFFAPKPEPPRIIPAPRVGSRLQESLVLAVGGLLLALCLYHWSNALFGGATILTATSVLLYVGGGYAVVRHGLPRWAQSAQAAWSEARYREPPWWALAARRAWAARHHRPARREAPGNSDQSRDAPKPDVAGFAAKVEERLNRWFARIQRRADEGSPSKWMHDSRIIRTTLAEEIVSQYESKRPLPELHALDWLMRWHAETIFQKWRRGGLHDDHEWEVSRSGKLQAIFGPVILGSSVATAAINSAIYSSGPTLLPSMLWTVGNAAAWSGLAILHRNCALVAWFAREAERRKLEENKVFADRYESLQDRPTDAEIASWLDYDKAHIKATAMRHFGLANRDLIAHVVLTGPSPPTYAARVLYGPLRYSYYTVQVFLLTERGVREMSVDLRLATGTISDERRRNFSYDAVSSAQVAELGVRVDGIQSGDVDDVLVDRTKVQRDNKPGKFVFSQEFQLALNNMQSVRLIIGNFDDGLVDRVREDPRHLFELARDTSGVTPALRILEAIAAEGSDWVRQERLRRRRRMIDYQRKLGERPELRAGDSSDSWGDTAPHSRINRDSSDDRYVLGGERNGDAELPPDDRDRTDRRDPKTSAAEEPSDET